MKKTDRRPQQKQYVSQPGLMGGGGGGGGGGGEKLYKQELSHDSLAPLHLAMSIKLWLCANSLNHEL